MNKKEKVVTAPSVEFSSAFVLYTYYKLPRVLYNDVIHPVKVDPPIPVKKLSDDPIILMAMD